MKRKVKVTGPDGKVTEGEVEIPNKGHFEAQLRYRAAIHRPKKGRGSFRRKKGPDPGDG